MFCLGEGIMAHDKLVLLTSTLYRSKSLAIIMAAKHGSIRVQGKEGWPLKSIEYPIVELKKQDVSVVAKHLETKLGVMQF